MSAAAQDARPVVAVTGATGFVGRKLVVQLAAAGWRVRLLMRRDPVVSEWRGIEPQIVAGDLSDSRALRQLVDGVQHVVHVAGLIKAARRRDFFAVNAAGSEAVAQAMNQHAPQARLLHVSTIAAREPQLSDYAASKREGEEVVRRLLGPKATVLRPPAVYGPGDRESLLFFQLGRQRFVPLAGPPSARAAMIHVVDLVAVMAAMLPISDGGVWTAADGNPQGYSWAEVFGEAARAVGNARAKLFHAPAALLGVAALVGDVGRLCGNANMLCTQKLHELRHTDWTVSAQEHARPAGWVPRYSLAEGFADAVRWYRAAGWLPAA
jgi:nucleoside-diphosphate-sugar epimerase